MRISVVFRSIGSGAVLYVAMAACGSSDSIVAAMSDGGASEGSTTDAAPILDAFIEELGHPVKDAKADPLPPDVATEACDKTGMYAGSASDFAVHDYPGLSVEDLSAVRAIGHISNVATGTIGANTYDRTTTVPSVLIRAGSVAVYCGQSGVIPRPYDSVTFVLAK